MFTEPTTEPITSVPEPAAVTPDEEAVAPMDDSTATLPVIIADTVPAPAVNLTGSKTLRTHSLFFTPENDGKDFSSVLQEVQAYISANYSTC